MSVRVLVVAAAILAICLAAPLLYDQFVATGMRAAARRSRSVLTRSWEPPFPMGCAVRLDLPAYWLVLLPVEFPAVYLTGAFRCGLICDGAIRSATPTRQAASGKCLRAARWPPALRCSGLFVSTIGNNDLGWRAVLPGVIGADGFRRGWPGSAGSPSARRGRRGRRAGRGLALGLPEGIGGRARERRRHARTRRQGVRADAGRCGPRCAGTRRPMSGSPTTPCSGGSDALAGQPLVGAAVGPPLVLRGPRVVLAYTALPARAAKRSMRSSSACSRAMARPRMFEELATRYDCRARRDDRAGQGWRKRSVCGEPALPS